MDMWNPIIGHLKFITLYLSSVVTAGLLHNMFKNFILYHCTGILVITTTILLY